MLGRNQAQGAEKAGGQQFMYSAMFYTHPHFLYYNLSVVEPRVRV